MCYSTVNCQLQVRVYASCTHQVLKLYHQSCVCFSQHIVNAGQAVAMSFTCLLHTGTWSASLCDRLSLSANVMLLNHQPADPRVGAFMLCMIAQALHTQLAGFPLPEDSTQHIAARAARVNIQSAALMQPTDDVMIVGISALAVLVLRLVGEEQGTFAPATLPSHDDLRWFTSMLLIKAFQQYAGHRLGGILVMLSAILLQQFGGNVFNLDFAQMHFAVSLGEPLMPHLFPVFQCYACRSAATPALDLLAGDQVLAEPQGRLRCD